MNLNSGKIDLQDLQTILSKIGRVAGYVKVFNVEDKISNFISKKKGNNKVFDEPINEMNEICGRLDTYLSRFHSRRLALAEENGKVFSDQLSLFQYLLSGKWQKVRVTNSPFYTYLGGKDLFFGNDAGQITASDHGRYFRCIEIKDYFQDYA